MTEKKCIHCLEEGITVTDDHVFPLSWYPTTTPQNIEKWKAPACLNCNGKLGRIEKKLLRYFIHTVNPQKNGFEKIWQNVRRSIDPSVSKNQRDRNARENEKNAFYRAILPRERIEPQNVLNPESYNNPAAKIGFCVEEADLKRFFEKIVRGVNYLYGENKYISNAHDIDLSFRESASQDLLRYRHEQYACGSAIKIKFWQTQYPPCGVMEICVWEQYCVMAYVENRLLINRD